ncbi:MAG: AgrD family cyclic lactone autoinducer peptide [Solirubrobacterales bacterium]
MNIVLKRTMTLLGCFGLLLGSLMVQQNSSFFFYEPKCPDEFLK